MQTNQYRPLLNRFITAVKLVCALSCITTTSLATAQDDGSAKFATCISCHGETGQGNTALSAPAIAGQADYYIEAQLTQFRRGLRGTHIDDIHGKSMKAIADSLEESDIPLLASYISKLAPAAVVNGLQGNIEQGEELYKSTCMSCHGVHAQGNALLKTPNLKILDAQYIALQIDHFANKVRGQDVEGNISAIWMRSVSTQVNTETQLQDISAYLNSLR